MLLRQELAGTQRDPARKNVYDCLVDAVADLGELSYMGTGSLAYVRSEAEGSRVYVRTNSGWEAVGSVGSAQGTK